MIQRRVVTEMVDQKTWVLGSGSDANNDGNNDNDK